MEKSIYFFLEWKVMNFPQEIIFAERILAKFIFSILPQKREIWLFWEPAKINSAKISAHENQFLRI